MFNVEQNHAGQDCYVVQYDEDQWKRYDTERQEFCLAEWVKQATPMGAHYIVLRLLPDALFPSGDKTAPYVARTIPIQREDFDPVQISIKLCANIDADTWDKASEMQRGNLKTAARTKLGMIAAQLDSGVSYEIMTRENNVAKRVEAGKL